jgi:signal transduction histidine kinase/ligand-binding sensor domain-containing protein
MQTRFLLVLLTCLGIAGVFNPANGQLELGLPFIQNFAPKTYNQGTQNFAIIQNKEGILFAGNNNGVLSYDGHQWRLIEVSNKSEVHSLAEDATGRIYVGAQGEFGYLQQKSPDHFEYISLLSLLPAEDRNFNDVWSIYCAPQRVIFRSTTGIYIYQDNKISTIKLSSSSHRSFYVYDELFIRENNSGLRKLSGDSLILVPGGEKFLKEPVHAMLPYGERQYLVVTQNEGLYVYNNISFTPFRSEADSLLKGQNIYGQRLPDGSYALCTRNHGLVMIDASGNLKYHIDKEHGLISESLWDVCADRFSGNLWVATNNGISFIEIKSPFYAFQSAGGVSGQIYHLASHEGYVYAASSLGVYALNLTSRDRTFKLLPELATQSWHFYKDSTTLLAATNNGIFQIRNNSARNIGFKGRAWFFQPLKKDSAIFVNTADGFVILKKNGDSFVVESTTPRFNESLYYFMEDENGNIWADSPIKGMYKIQLPKRPGEKLFYKLYNKENGFPADYRNKAFTYNGEVRFSTTSGIYRYDNDSDSVMFDRELNTSLFGDRMPEIEWVEQDHNRNIWFVIKSSDREKNFSLGGFALFNKEQYTVNTDIFWRVSDLKIRDYMTLDANNILIATSDGILKFDPQKIGQPGFPVRLSGLVSTENDSSFMTHDPDNLTFSSDHSSIRISYAGMNFTGTPHTYGTFLEGFDNHWQPWSSASSKEYTNLPPGSYKFHVRAKNAYNKLSEELIVPFTIKPPWFKTSWAYIFFSIVTLSVIYSVLYFRSRTLIAKNIRLEKLVSERTSELQQKHDDLIRVNTLLENQKEEIESQKEDIEQKNQELTVAKNTIDKQNAELRTINRDLETAVNERTQELQLAYRNLLQTKEELDTFIYRSSHDIKGPLLRILGLCNVALLDVKDELSYGYFKKLEREIALTNKMLHKLILVQNVKNVTITPTAFNLRNLLQMAISKLEKEEGYEAMTFNLDESLNVKMESDQYLLGTAIQNVIENAIVYRRSSRPEVTITFKRTDDKGLLTISDNGKGISGDVSSHIFEMFYRGSEFSVGAGLGLYITKKALQRLNGDIVFHPNDYTTFVLELSSSHTKL